MEGQHNRIGVAAALEWQGGRPYQPKGTLSDSLSGFVGFYLLITCTSSQVNLFLSEKQVTWQVSAHSYLEMAPFWAFFR